MNGVEYMAKQKKTRYYKPNMGALSGKIGESIFETIMNSPKPDRSELKKHADACRNAILAEMNEEKQ